MRMIFKNVLVGILFMYSFTMIAQSDTVATPVNVAAIDSVEFLYLGGYIIVPSSFKSGTTNLDVWTIFDTGTTGSMLITKAFMQELTGATAQVAFADSITVGTGKFDRTMLVGVDHPAIFILDSMHRDVLGDKKIVGLMGYPMMAKYITSIDYVKKKIYFRPLDSEQRTLSVGKPIAQVTYRDDRSTIWFPLIINKEIKGFAHVDSGYPFTWVEKTKVPTKVNSFVINEYEFMGMMSDIEFRPLEQEGSYGEMGFNLIGNLGNSFLEKTVFTIDPTNKLLYFEGK